MDVKTEVEYAYQGIVNNYEYRQQIMDTFINLKKIPNAKYGGTLVFDMKQIKKQSVKEKTTQTKIIQQKLQEILQDVEKSKSTFMVWNVEVIASETLAHFGTFAYDTKKFYYFDSGYSTILKNGVYGQVYTKIYKSFLKLIDSKMNMVDVSIYNVNKNKPIQSQTCDAFCQTWSLWWSMQFLYIQNAEITTKLLFSMNKVRLEKIPLLLAIAIVTKTTELTITNNDNPGTSNTINILQSDFNTSYKGKIKANAYDVLLKMSGFAKISDVDYPVYDYERE